jgi:hypothetical protein
MLHPHIISHGAHPAFAKLVGADERSVAPPPPLDPESAEAREMLEALDDAVFAAIAGDRAAMSAARKLWPEAVEALGWELIEESREQYLRHAVEVTRRFEWSETRDPAAAMAAIEVIELVTKG